VRTAALLGIAAIIAGGCQAAPSVPAFTEHRDERAGFTIRIPGGWMEPSLPTGGPEVRFVPRGEEAQSAEFISVFTVPAEGAPSESEIRRQVFGLLPVHGVSGFQRDPRTTADVLWYRFELTGSSGSTEWALVGVAAAGPARMQIAVCAKPLESWRGGQTQCDEVVRSFVPGDLAAK
jgi:hypothetical protein